MREKGVGNGRLQLGKGRQVLKLSFLVGIRENVFEVNRKSKAAENIKSEIQVNAFIGFDCI